MSPPYYNAILGESLFSLTGFLDDIAEFSVKLIGFLKEFLTDGGIVSALLSFSLHVNLVLKVVEEVDGLIEKSAESLVISL